MGEYKEEEYTEEKAKAKRRAGVVSASILSGTFQDSLKEKKVLKRLNIMDYVHHGKDAFFREVEELNLNPSVLLDNWKAVKTNTEISRKLSKKLGIIMARERARRKKKDKMEKMLQQMLDDNDDKGTDSTTDSDDGDDSDSTASTDSQDDVKDSDT